MRRGLAIVLGACALLAGTGSTPAGAASSPMVSTARARTEIARLVETTYPGLAHGNVACPPTARRVTGATFTCTVQLPGTFLVVDATQSGTTGSFSLATPQAVLTKQAMEQFVAANASLSATVDCGPAFLVRRPGDTVTCSAALADGTTRVVTLTVRDTSGAVTITSVA
ncbi:MAG: DUF4333 domain-containing protein [Acidimicrobiia bacterium]